MSECQSVSQIQSKTQPKAMCNDNDVSVWRQIKVNDEWMSDRYKSVNQIHWTQKFKCVWGTRTDLTGSHASRAHISFSFGFNGDSLMDPYSLYYIF